MLIEKIVTSSRPKDEEKEEGPYIKAQTMAVMLRSADIVDNISDMMGVIKSLKEAEQQEVPPQLELARFITSEISACIHAGYGLVCLALSL